MPVHFSYWEEASQYTFLVGKALLNTLLLLRRERGPCQYTFLIGKRLLNTRFLFRRERGPCVAVCLCVAVPRFLRVMCVCVCLCVCVSVPASASAAASVCLPVLLAASATLSLSMRGTGIMYAQSCMYTMYVIHVLLTGENRSESERFLLSRKP